MLQIQKIFWKNLVSFFIKLLASNSEKIYLIKEFFKLKRFDGRVPKKLWERSKLLRCIRFSKIFGSKFANLLWAKFNVSKSLTVSKEPKKKAFFTNYFFSNENTNYRIKQDIAFDSRYNGEIDGTQNILSEKSLKIFLESLFLPFVYFPVFLLL